MQKKKFTAACLIETIIELCADEKNLCPLKKNLCFVNGENYFSIDKFRAVAGTLYIYIEKKHENEIKTLSFKNFILEILACVKKTQKSLCSEVVFTDDMENIYKIKDIDNDYDKLCYIYMDKTKLI